MATKDEREKQKDPIQDVQPLGEYGTMGSSGRKKRKQAVTGGPAEVATERAQPTPEALQAAEKAETVIETTAEAEGKPGLADTFKEIAPFLVATALGGLDAGFAAQRGAITAKAAQNEAELRRRETEAKIGATQQELALQGSTDPNSEASRIAREEARKLTKGQIEIPESMSEAEINQLQKSLMSSANVSLEEKGRTLRAERNLEQREKDYKLRKQKFEQQQTKEGSFSEQQVNKLAQADTVIQAIDDISELKVDVGTGILDEKYQSLLQLADESPKEFNMLQAEAENLVADYIRSISGAQASEREVERLKRVAPNTADNDKVFVDKLTTFRKIMRRSQNSLLKAIKAGQPLKAGVVDELIDKIEKEEEAAGIGGKMSTPALPENITNNPKYKELKRRGVSDQQIMKALGM